MMRVDRQAELRKYHKHNSSELWLYVKRDGDSVRGVMCTPCIAGQIPFENLAELLLKANQIFDAIDFPQRFMAKRSVNGTQETTMPSWVAANLQEPIYTEGGGCGTYLCPNAEEIPFYIRVYQRQNASWQGELHCLSSGHKCCFRSALELMELLTQAVEEQQSGILESAAV